MKQGKKTQESLVLYDKREARGTGHYESFKGFIFQKEGVINLDHGYNKRPSIMKTKIWSLLSGKISVREDIERAKSVEYMGTKII